MTANYTKARYFSFIIYPESIPTDWRAIPFILSCSIWQVNQEKIDSIIWNGFHNLKGIALSNVIYHF